MEEKHGYTVELVNGDAIDVPYWSMSKAIHGRALARDLFRVSDPNGQSYNEGLASVIQMQIVLLTLGLRDQQNADGRVADGYRAEDQLEDLLKNSEENYYRVVKAIYDKQLQPMLKNAAAAVKDEQESPKGEEKAATDGSTSPTE